VNNCRYDMSKQCPKDDDCKCSEDDEDITVPLSLKETLEFLELEDEESC